MYDRFVLIGVGNLHEEIRILIIQKLFQHVFYQKRFSISSFDPGSSFVFNKTRMDSDLIYIKEELLDFFFSSSEFSKFNLTMMRRLTNINDIIQFFDKFYNDIECFLKVIQ